MKTIRFQILLAAIFLLSGCQAHVFSYQGAKVTRQNDIIPLSGQEAQKGIWKTNELSVEYSYQVAGVSLQMSGIVKLVGGFAVGFKTIDQLSVQVLFLDDQGTVLANDVLYSVQAKTPSDLTPLRFNRSFPVPAGTQGIAFTYDGSLSDGGGVRIVPFRGIDGGGRTQVRISYFPS
ncbi:MAG: hypothetical protein Q7U40_06480 [Desulfatirhabdiaceae bacterium]|nr:hypothetical protein [Desulfatirhabdiaceae bacterium]